MMHGQKQIECIGSWSSTEISPPNLPDLCLAFWKYRWYFKLCYPSIIRSLMTKVLSSITISATPDDHKNSSTWRLGFVVQFISFIRRVSVNIHETKIHPNKRTAWSWKWCSIEEINVADSRNIYRWYVYRLNKFWRHLLLSGAVNKHSIQSYPHSNVLHTRTRQLIWYRYHTSRKTGVGFPAGQGIFILSESVQFGSGTYPSSYLNVQFGSVAYPLSYLNVQFGSVIYPDSHLNVQFGSGTYTGSYLKDTRGSSHRSKAAGARSWWRLSGASVTNAWSDTSTFRYVVMAWCVIKHEEIFNV